MRWIWTGAAFAGAIAVLIFAVATPTRPNLRPIGDPLPEKSSSFASGPAEKIVASARTQATEGALYTVGYFKLPYPNGDLPRTQGVCTDVVIRALRGAGYDLQKLIHEDMVRHFNSYPRREGHPDSNIDHRRVPNQMHYFAKFGKALTLKTDPAHRSQWQPGDLVYWKLPSGLDHAGVLIDRIGASGLPMVVHNLSKCCEEDVVAAWKIQGHFRFPQHS
jgi:uncharacterized protein YijF (DUF1287 family)